MADPTLHDTPTSVITAGEIPGFGSATWLGLKLLGLAVTIDVCRETWKLARGAPTDFPALAGRAVVGAVCITGIPWLSVTVSGLVTDVAGYLLQVGRERTFDRAFLSALGDFGCDNLAWWQYIKLLFSASGWIIIGAQLVTPVFVVVKLVIIDVLWPIFFCLVVYMGVISVPVSYVRDMGGMSVYARNVASVALWPVVYAMLMAMVGATFVRTIAAVAHGDVGLACDVVMPLPEGSGARLDGVVGSIWGVIRWAAMCLGCVVLTIKTPAFCAVLLGAQSPMSLVQEMTSGSTNKAKQGAKAAVGKAL